MKKDKKNMITVLIDIAKNYEFEPEETCNEIDLVLAENGWKKGGGEMSRVDRWEKGAQKIYIHFDPEFNRIGIA